MSSKFIYTSSLAIAEWEAGFLVRLDQEQCEILADVPAPPPRAIKVGEIDGKPVAAVWETPERGINLRAAQLHPEPAVSAAVNRARQLLHHLKVHRFCGVCGAENRLSGADTALVCPACGNTVYPRIDPAVIVAVTRGDRLLLAHNRRFANGVFSLVAGFVEGGETMEMAVRREVEEEVGIRVKNIRYVHSQFWPFPHSLMLGCFAEYADGELSPDGDEISEAGFFPPHALPATPAPGSVAHRLIELWKSGALPR